VSINGGVYSVEFEVDHRKNDLFFLFHELINQLKEKKIQVGNNGSEIKVFSYGEIKTL
jgi:hypothetical protein